MAQKIRMAFISLREEGSILLNVYRIQASIQYSLFIVSPSATGFCNWKKGVKRLTDHDKSENHENATKQKRNTQPTVHLQISKPCKRAATSEVTRLGDPF